LKKIDELYYPYYNEWTVQTFENIVLLIGLICVACFVCKNSTNRVPLIIFFFCIGILLILYQIWVSRVYFNLKKDIIEKKIKKVTAKIDKISSEHTLSKFDGSSCVGWFYSEKDNVGRYKLHFTDEHQNKGYVRVVIPALKALGLICTIADKTVTFYYYEKSKVLLEFVEEGKKRRKDSLNYYIKCPCNM